MKLLLITISLAIAAIAQTKIQTTPQADGVAPPLPDVKITCSSNGSTFSPCGIVTPELAVAWFQIKAQSQQIEMQTKQINSLLAQLEEIKAEISNGVEQQKLFGESQSSCGKDMKLSISRDGRVEKDSSGRFFCVAAPPAPVAAPASPTVIDSPAAHPVPAPVAPKKP